MSSRVNFLIPWDRRASGSRHEALQPIPSRQIAVFWDRGQLLVMCDQHTFHVSQFVCAKRPCFAALGTRNTGIEHRLCTPIQVEIGARSRFASHEERKIDHAQQADDLITITVSRTDHGKCHVVLKRQRSHLLGRQWQQHFLRQPSAPSTTHRVPPDRCTLSHNQNFRSRIILYLQNPIFGAFSDLSSFPETHNLDTNALCS